MPSGGVSARSLLGRSAASARGRTMRATSPGRHPPDRAVPNEARRSRSRSTDRGRYRVDSGSDRDDRSVRRPGIAPPAGFPGHRPATTIETVSVSSVARTRTVAPLPAYFKRVVDQIHHRTREQVPVAKRHRVDRWIIGDERDAFGSPRRHRRVRPTSLITEASGTGVKDWRRAPASASAICSSLSSIRISSSTC